MQRRYAYIISACRTPIGIFNGKLAPLTAPQLGIKATTAALQRVASNVPKELIDEVIYGNVVSAGLGQAPARQVAMGCELPLSTVCTTINKVCSSGMKAVCYGTQSIELGHSNIIIAGGMESMSNVPYYCNKTRFGARMGDITVFDGLLRDGLSDAYTDDSMGNFAEKCSFNNSISREEQDNYAIESYERAIKATKEGIFKKHNEIISIEIASKNKKDPPSIINEDEGISKLNKEKLRTLKPSFAMQKGQQIGTVTAGNSSQISDGAASLILVSEEMLKKLNITNPLAKILSYADAEQHPSDFCTTPSIAIPKALKKAGINIKDIGSNDFIEINEAFAVVTIANCKKLNFKHENTNIYGGAVALGHPIGCSGARLICTLITALKENKGRYGIAGVCNGGGGATSVVIENLM